MKQVNNSSPRVVWWRLAGWRPYKAEENVAWNVSCIMSSGREGSVLPSGLLSLLSISECSFNDPKGV